MGAGLFVVLHGQGVKNPPGTAGGGSGTISDGTVTGQTVYWDGDSWEPTSDLLRATTSPNYRFLAQDATHTPLIVKGTTAQTAAVFSTRDIANADFLKAFDTGRLCWEGATVDGTNMICLDADADPASAIVLTLPALSGRMVVNPYDEAFSAPGFLGSDTTVSGKVDLSNAATGNESPGFIASLNVDPPNGVDAGQRGFWPDPSGNGWRCVDENDAPCIPESIQFVFDGGGAALSAGDQAWVQVPWGCTITGSEITATPSGSVVVDLWLDTPANFPPTDADSITASAPPTLSSAVRAADTTLTGWTTAVAKDSYIKANVDSATTVEYVVVSLSCAY